MSETQRLFFIVFCRESSNAPEQAKKNNRNVRIEIHQLNQLNREKIIMNSSWLLVFVNRLRYKMSGLHDIFVGC